MAQGIGVMQGYRPGMYTNSGGGNFTVSNLRGSRYNPIRTSPTKYKGYINSVHSGKSILVYLASMPESVEEAFTVNIYSESPIGSAQPVQGFSSIAARTISVSFEVDQSYLPSPYTTVHSYVYALKNMIYPSYGNGVVHSPEFNFRLVNIAVRGIVTSMNVTWGSTVRNGSIDTAKISLSITETQNIVGGTATNKEKGVVS